MYKKGRLIACLLAASMIFVLLAPTSLASSKSVGSRLSGHNLIIYNYVREAIAEIATSYQSRTTIEIPLDEFGVDVEKEYSAEDLGLEYLYNGGWNPAIGTALLNFIDFDSNLIMNALYADCAFDLYWAESMTFPTSLGFSTLIYTSGDETIYSVRFPQFFPVMIRVEPKYRNNNDPQGYELDDTRIKLALDAAGLAQTIVNEAAGLDDYAKLLYYKNRICDLVAYDNNAALYPNQSDRSPWTLLYVFDDNARTNVVCEGYAEAFQYLCELTDFNDDSICAYSVTGTMTGGTGGGGRHKWNIVHMDDGHNYIADITNSDEGSWGANGELFLKGIQGGVDAGYGLESANPANSIHFDYDDATRALFSDDELTLSRLDYGQSADDVADMTGINLMLTDKIGMRVHVSIDTRYVTNDDYIQFEYDGETIKQYVEEADPSTEAGEDDNHRIIIFELPLTATEMAKEITFHMVIDNKEGTAETYSVKDYAEAIIADTTHYSQKERDLVTALLNYGTYSQLYFNVDTDNLPVDSPALGWNDQTDDAALDQYTYVVTKKGEASKLSLVSATLLLYSEISLRFSVEFNNGLDLSYYDISVVDEEGYPVAYSIAENDLTGKHHILIDGIGPLELVKMYRLTISEGGTTIVDVTYGPLSYCQAMIHQDGASDKIKNLCKAIYKYYEAACALDGANE